MSVQPNDNVILFPKTVEYYQFELTRLLEAERYGEAVALLRFLLACRSDDGTVKEEWQALLDWLQMMFPDLAAQSFADADADKEEEITEADLLRRHMQNREENQEEYARKLLDSLKEQQAVDKLLLALDQLAFLGHPDIDGTLLRLLTEQQLHPLIQFKALQTLKKRGVNGTAVFVKNGETVEVDIEETPSGFDQFPAQVQEIIARVQQISETKHPALSYFASETWSEFLAFVYGTAAYRQMLRQDQACVDVWACALHWILLDKVLGGGDKVDLLEMYGITNDLAFPWEQACRVMQQFAANVFPRGL